MAGKEKRSAQEPLSYHVYLLSYLHITIFHSGCLSRSYLGKYQRDRNQTWFIDG